MGDRNEEKFKKMDHLNVIEETVRPLNPYLEWMWHSALRYSLVGHSEPKVVLLSKDLSPLLCCLSTQFCHHSHYLHPLPAHPQLHPLPQPFAPTANTSQSVHLSKLHTFKAIPQKQLFSSLLTSVLRGHRVLAVTPPALVSQNI